MLFMINSRPKDGVTRDQLIEHLTARLNPETWDLIRSGVVSHVLYKVGEEPGFFAVVNAAGREEVEALVKESLSRQDVFDLEIVPVRQFPHFD